MVSLVLVVLAPVFIAAGNYLLIGRLIRAVLPPTHHKIFGVPARFLTPFFVTCDVLAFLVQGGGSGLASSDNWTGPNKDAGEKVLIAGLAFQFVAFSAYLCIFVRFHRLGKVVEVETAPGGWRNVVRAVYVSSSLIMVSDSGVKHVAYGVWCIVHGQTAAEDMHFPENFLQLIRCDV